MDCFSSRIAGRVVTRNMLCFGADHIDLYWEGETVFSFESTPFFNTQDAHFEGGKLFELLWNWWTDLYALTLLVPLSLATNVWPHISHTWRIRLTVAGSVWVLLLVIESWTVSGDVPNYVKVELLNQLRYAVEQAFWAKPVADRVTCDIQGLLVWDRHGVWAQCERTKEWIHDSYDGCMSHFSKCFSFESAHARVNSG